MSEQKQKKKIRIDEKNNKTAQTLMKYFQK